MEAMAHAYFNGLHRKNGDFPVLQFNNHFFKSYSHETKYGISKYMPPSNLQLFHPFSSIFMVKHVPLSMLKTASLHCCPA
jgi:hypothetical protein